MSLIPSSVSSKIAHTMIKLKQDSPRLLFVGGVIGVVGGTVLACRGTLRLHETLDELSENVEAVKAREITSSEEDKAQKRELTFVYLNGSFQIAKLYAPAVIVTGASITALTQSHMILTRRNAALGAMYTALAAKLEDYRAHIREEIGPDREREIYNGIEWQEVPGSDGKVLEPVVSPGQLPPHTRFFDKTNRNWNNNAETNRMFLNCQQAIANDLLHVNGYLFLNDVYDMLGIDRSPAGQLVGWALGFDGEDYVDFGMYDAFQNAEFQIGGVKDVMLEFNVDPGLIWDKIDGKGKK